MQNKANYPFFRRIFFPYSGEEPLTTRQALRVMLAWLLFIPLIMTLCTLAISLTFAFSVPKMLLSLLFTFLIAAFIYGLMGMAVVGANNRAARIRQERRARNGQV